ncbi:hypothetical protein SKAU_G00023210 [Synaphobranchus kaupii]|uniref:Unique cartilage matrix-associated protein n=1 Tax=Synaphobranchus kaupii TaxID=118154 RepID=A0A9Q1GDF3_SYNKA|nr:hypothetical protein SKAU_G00023210 [Synaphobranchus kaupii]
MTWTRPVILAQLAVLLVLTLNNGAESAAVRDDPADAEAGALQDAARRIFMPEADAANFFRRRSRRTAKSQAEINGEAHDLPLGGSASYPSRPTEQNERTREKTEQWREFHYDGLYPSYQYNRHHI